MATKRKGEDAPPSHPMKQSKLDFGRRSRVKSASEQISAPHQRHSPSDALTRRASVTDGIGSADQGAITRSSGDGAHTDSPAGASSGVTHIKVVDKVGDIFDAPPDTVIIHACNGLGHWGAGIAAAFKQRYPQAYRKHLAYCKTKQPAELVGTAQLIAPCEVPGKDGEARPKHYVGCLFTSKRYGRSRDKPEKILAATGPALKGLLGQVRRTVAAGETVTEIRTCQINAGMFAVPWQKSREAMQRIKADGLDEALTTIVAYVRE